MVALSSISANRLRAIITMLIIAIGITALVGILSAIDAVKNAISTNFTEMGANTFTIRQSDRNIRVGRKGKKKGVADKINYREAVAFREEFNFPAITSVFTEASGMSRVKYGAVKTNPNISVYGVDENYLTTAGYDLAMGRNLSNQEAARAAHVVMIGMDVKLVLFGKQNPVDKVISIGPHRFRVIGVLKTKGNSAGFGGDKVCLIPVAAARQYFGGPQMTFNVNVLAGNHLLLDVLTEEARAVFRRVRRLATYQPDDFEIVKADSLAEMLLKNISMVTTGATVIGIITLLGAAIGLMNIMLVSVTERTREIGIRKATGATRANIRAQFLIESTVICLLGGACGILLGILIGNVISMSMDIGFFIPWFWILSGVAICITVGLISGYIPARRAADLDPVDSLRFE